MPTNFQIEYSQTESTNCPYCHTQIAQQETAMRCAECDSVYHQNCWAELDKCGLFGCEETVAHAVRYQTILGNGGQSRWLGIPDEIVRVDSVPNVQKSANKMPPLTREERSLTMKNLINDPRKVLPSFKSIREARNYYREREGLDIFDWGLFLTTVFTILSLVWGYPPISEGIDGGGIVMMLLWLLTTCMASMFWFLVLALIDRARDKNEKTKS